MKFYAFDVDECLWTSRGPVTEQMLKDLHATGDAILGICGNLSAFLPRYPDWHKIISVTMNFDFGYNNQYGMSLVPKAIWLHCFQHVACPGLESYTMVGNKFGRVNSCGVSCGSHDDMAAQQAGWRFLLEDEFAAGQR